MTPAPAQPITPPVASSSPPFAFGDVVFRAWWLPDEGRYEWRADCGRMAAFAVSEEIPDRERDPATGRTVRRVYEAQHDGQPVGRRHLTLIGAMQAAIMQEIKQR